MTEVILVKTEQGELEGLGERNRQRYQRFQRRLDAMEPGETMAFAWKLPRSSPFHRRHFAVLTVVFDQQEQFHDPEAFRAWVQVGAGHCDLVPGPTGKPVAIPKSISFEKLDDDAFREHHEAVVRFLRTTHATRFLWPHLSDLQADNFINVILMEFDR